MEDWKYKGGPRDGDQVDGEPRDEIALLVSKMAPDCNDDLPRLTVKGADGSRYIVDLESHLLWHQDQPIPPHLMPCTVFAKVIGGPFDGYSCSQELASSWRNRETVNFQSPGGGLRTSNVYRVELNGPDVVLRFVQSKSNEFGKMNGGMFGGPLPDTN